MVSAQLLYRVCGIVALAVSGASAVVSALVFSGTAHQAVFALPASFLVAGGALVVISWRTGPSLVLAVCLATAFLRYSLFPLLAAIDGGYVGRSWIAPSNASVDLAVTLMVYEILGVTALITWLELRHARSKVHGVKSERLRLLPGWYIAALALLAVLLALLFPESLGQVNVGVPIIPDGDDTLAPAATFAAMLIVVVKSLTAVGLIWRLALLTRYVNLATVAAFLVAVANVTVYFGTGRIATVLTAAASIWLLRTAFGPTRLLSVGVFVVTLTTATVYSVVTDARDYPTLSTSRLTNMVDSIQVYTGGVYNVAIGVEVGSFFPEAARIDGLFFDFARSTIGLNLLAQRLNMRYSNEYFNDRMWVHVDRRSQILPMIAQGYLYFPAPLSITLSLAFVYLGYALQGAIRTTGYVELKYLLALIALRMGFFWGQNSMNMMTYISIYLLIPLMLIAVYDLGRRAIGSRRGAPNKFRPHGYSRGQ